MHVYVVGFAKFGPYGVNSSEQVIKHLTHHPTHIAGVWPSFEVLPAHIPAYDRGEYILRSAYRLEAGAVLALGMSSSSRALTIESRAQNLVSHPHYCTSAENGAPVDLSAPLRQTVELDLRGWDLDRFIQNTVEALLPRPEWSVDTSGFCCNHLMFQMHRAQERLPELADMPWLFVHLPCTPEAVPPGDRDFATGRKRTMTVEELAKNITILLRTAVPRERKRPKNAAASVTVI